MTRQSNHGPPQTISSPSSSSSRLSAFREYVSHRRRLLGCVAILILIIMIVGVVVTAHQYAILPGFVICELDSAPRETLCGQCRILLFCQDALTS
jgi:hypothetical protein